MHRPTRHIEVFDISLMAVVTKAMGAFLVLTVLLLPYYKSDPDVDATSAKAQAQLDQTRKALDDLARQLAADPQNAAALGAMREALDQARDRIDDLSKQASALSSQLERAQQAADTAKADADSARAGQQAARVLAANAEQAANAASQAQRAAQGQAAATEQRANQAVQAERAAQAQAAALEQNANSAAQAERARAVTLARAEAVENRQAGLLAHSVLTPQAMILADWDRAADCLDAPIDLRLHGTVPPYIPDGVDLPDGNVENALFDRSGEIAGNLVPDPPSGAAASEPPASSLYFAGLWSPKWRGYLYAGAEHVLPADCHIAARVMLYDFARRRITWREHAALTIPANGRPQRLLMVTDADGGPFPAETPDDQSDWAAWASQQPAPPAAPAPK